MYGYFEIQAKIGLTKHIGGIRSTKELISKCNINSSSYILVIGSGNGTSSVKIREISGCRIVGIDISKDMVSSAKEKEREGVKFMLGNAEKIPFPDSTFDAVISESVTAFTDKKKSISEYFRVLKKGGYLGLNEVTWLNEPNDRIKDFAIKVVGGLVPEIKKGWIDLIKKQGFNDISERVSRMKKFEQFAGEIQMQGTDFLKIWGKFFKLYFCDREYRKSVNKMAVDAVKMPRGFIRNFGYGIYVGRK